MSRTAFARRAGATNTELGGGGVRPKLACPGRSHRFLVVLSIVQTVGIIVAAFASAYAVAASELNRRLDARRARVERVLQAMLQLAEAALRMQEMQGQGVAYEVARRR